jgi:hypothetical protein
MTTTLQPPPSAALQESSPAGLAPPLPVEEGPEREGPFWGDRFALQVWVVCFVFQWLIVLVSSFTGLCRW